MCIVGPASGRWTRRTPGPGEQGRNNNDNSNTNPFSLSVEANGESDEAETLGQDSWGPQAQLGNL